MFDDVSAELRDVHAALNALGRDVRRATPAKGGKVLELPLSTLLWRSLAARLVGYVEAGPSKAPSEGEDPLVRWAAAPYYQSLRRVAASTTTKATTTPAATGTTGWASELAQQVTQAFFDAMASQSAFATLAGAGGARTVNLTGQDGVLKINGVSGTRPAVGATFIGELAAIPVRRSTFATTSLGPKKAATISTFSEELAEKSAPAIEAVLEAVITADTGLALDSVLVDATAASTIRPAGLRSYNAALTAATGTGRGDLMQADLAALIAAIQPSRRMALLANPAQAAALAYQFYASPLTIISTTALAAKTVIALDLDSFAIATWGGPEFQLSSETTLHEEDTTPLALSATGSPNTVAAPMRSLFQTDTIAVKLRLFVNWSTLRSGAVAWMSGVNW